MSIIKKIGLLNENSVVYLNRQGLLSRDTS